jgi:hypothetical protein
MNTPNRSHLTRTIEQKLRADRPAFSPPEGFTERVMARLDRWEPAPERSRFALPNFRLFFGLAAGACALVLTLQLIPRKLETPPAPPVAAASVSEVKLPSISFSQVEALTAKLDEPLETELRNVISDTRQAIQFVASNFLPEN